MRPVEDLHNDAPAVRDETVSQVGIHGMLVFLTEETFLHHSHFGDAIVSGGFNPFWGSSVSDRHCSQSFGLSQYGNGYAAVYKEKGEE